MNKSYQQLIKNFPSLEQNRPLAPFTTFGIGGPAEFFYKLTDIADFEPLMNTAQELKIPVFILGGGSNTIFADEGFRGLVIKMEAKKIALHGEAAIKQPASSNNKIVVAESGALLSQVIQFALKNQLTGMEKMMGLPGTIGGAVRGNAGAFGIETADIFEKALIYDSEKGLHEISKTELNFGYRTSKIKKSPGSTVLKVYLKLARAIPAQAKIALAAATDIVKNRISKQPKGKCSGSFFKNPVTPDYAASQPPETKAGHLLEQIGAKNMQIGGVKVSSEHANWLLNVASPARLGTDSATPPATQADVLDLSAKLQKAVKDRFDITLEREVQLVSADGTLI